MPRKRSKPVADHIDATEPTTPESSTSKPLAPDSIPVTEHPALAEPDIFDQMIAAQAAGQFEKPAPLTPPVPDTAARVEAVLAAAPVVRASEMEVPANKETHQDQPTAAPRTPVMPKIRERLPDPHSIEQISLDNDRNGVQMRLLRSNRHHDVWIQFDKNPGQEITEQIKAAGFRWEPRAEVGDKNGAWVKPLEQGREIRLMLDAERLFLDLGNQIRESKGLEPVGRIGQGAG